MNEASADTDPGPTFEAHLARVNRSAARLGCALVAIALPAWLAFVALGAAPSERAAGLGFVVLSMAVLFTGPWRGALVSSSAVAAIGLVPAAFTVANGEAPWFPLLADTCALALCVVVATSGAALRFREARRAFGGRKPQVEHAAEPPAGLAPNEERAEEAVELVALRQHNAPASAATPPEHPIVFERGRRARILVVADEGDLRALLASVLGARFEVITATSGVEALRRARESRPDLVLADETMPGSSGDDLCRELKADRVLRTTPVIVLTARSGAEATLEGFASGADDFVTKPFHVKVLLARIRTHLTVRSLTLQIADRARLEAAGMLAAGVAHEVRNPMNAVISAARVLEAAEVGPPQQKRLLEVLVDGVRRIDQVVSTLDAHARPADGHETTVCSIRDGIESTVRLLAHRCDGVAVHRDYGAEERALGPARAFNQIFLNLLDNAVRSGGKNVWVRVSSEDDELVVSVQDDGAGIAPHHAHHLFDPFFTARASGDGTGLGLFISRRLARACGGDLGYRARPAGGAEFVVRLPRLEVPA